MVGLTINVIETKEKIVKSDEGGHKVSLVATTCAGTSAVFFIDIFHDCVNVTKLCNTDLSLSVGESEEAIELVYERMIINDCVGF